MSRKRGALADVEVQVLTIGALILLVAIQSFVIAWGLNHAAAIAVNLERPDRSIEFFKLFLMIVVPFVTLNALIGSFVAMQLSKPLGDIRRAIHEVTRGNLELVLERDSGEFLGEYKADCNTMTETLRRLIYRDRDYASEANDILSRCQKLLSGNGKLEAGEKEKLEALVKEAKSRLSIINHHFTKGRRDPG